MIHNYVFERVETLMFKKVHLNILWSPGSYCEKQCTWFEKFTGKIFILIRLKLIELLYIRFNEILSLKKTLFSISVHESSDHS